MNVLKYLLLLIFVSSAMAQSLVVLPERFKNDKVVIENSEEYLSVLKNNKDLISQLEKERADKKAFEEKANKQSAENYKIQSQLLKDYNQQTLDLAKKDTIIVKKELALIGHRIVIVSLIGLIAAGIYLRIKGIL